MSTSCPGRKPEPEPEGRPAEPGAHSGGRWGPVHSFPAALPKLGPHSGGGARDDRGRKPVPRASGPRGRPSPRGWPEGSFTRSLAVQGAASLRSEHVGDGFTPPHTDGTQGDAR